MLQSFNRTREGFYLRDVSIDWPELREIDGTPQVDNLEHQWRRSLRTVIRPSDSTLNWEQLQEWWHLSAVAFADERYWESLYLLTRIRDAVAFHEAFPTVGAFNHQVAVDSATVFGVQHKCDYRCGRRKPNGQTLSLIERIKHAYRIEDIAARHTKLRGTHTLTGPCFLHAGSGSEFVIWVDEQRFACFGRCNTGGDVIDLVRAMNAGGIKWMKS